jgi:glyoxylase-like metal-dependent hydrolase (beta-lactamase superfamily II)
MRVHHLNCATFCPIGRLLINGHGGLAERGRLVCHCLLVEAGGRLILVDTGLGLEDLADPAHRLGLGPPWIALVRPRLDPRETALARVEALGYDARDVQDIVLTHLDFDHAGGLADFPWARVHVSGREFEAADAAHGWWARRRYKREQWAHGPEWVIHEPRGERWFGFDAVLAVDEPEGDVLLVPLHGHSAGHCGVAVKTGGTWLLLAGDAYFHHAEIDVRRPRCPGMLRVYRNVYQWDQRTRIRNEERLRELVRDYGGPGGRVRVINSHDPWYLEGRARLQKVGEVPMLAERAKDDGVGHRRQGTGRAGVARARGEI